MSGAIARPLADAEARRRIEEDLDTGFVVEAAAGTGKTTALVGRMIGLIRSGRARLEQIVAVTFTEKAAGEMKLRLRAELDRARHDEAPADERARFEQALAELEVARIGTIHGLCADLLRERPIEAAIDPGFTVAADEEAQALIEQAFDRWFEHALADPPEGLGRVLRSQLWSSGRGPRDLLVRACADLIDSRDHPAPWRRDAFDRRAALDAFVVDLEAVAALAERSTNQRDFLRTCLAQLARAAQRIRDREAVSGRDYDALEASLRGLRRGVKWNYRGWGDLYAEGLARADVIAQRDRLKDDLEALLGACEADLAACLHAELAPVVAAYEDLKARAGVLDFRDLLLLTRNLIAGDAGVRADLQRRFSHIFVDEFQDTDPLQAEILLLLSSDDPACDEASRATPVPGKLFCVGDPKQSIYRFRRADVSLYERVKRDLCARGSELLYLTTSFRGVPAIQAAVNRAFAEHMAGSEAGHQADYVSLQPYRAGTDERPSLIALPAPAIFGWRGKVTKWAVGQPESLPDAVAAFVDWLVNASGWTVDDTESGRPAAIETRHVCLLFRRFAQMGRDVTRPYVRALEARRIAHVLVGGRSFHSREEVMAVGTALEAIERPDDDLSVYATLRGPLFALGDDALLAYKEAARTLHPMRPPDDETRAVAPEVARALETLRGLHLGRNHRPIADTVARLLDATRAHAGIAIWPTGEQALANVLRVLDHARRFEARGATSFRAFVDWFADRAERGEGSEAPAVEEGTDGVRMMTVHRAKGLEFPVVILCDPGCARTRSRPSRWVDAEAGLWAAPLANCVPAELRDHEAEVIAADEAEEVRVAYVAATRARDILVVPVTGESRIAGWTDVLDGAIYPDREVRRDAGPAPGCPRFGPDSVADRPMDAPPTPDAAVAPGLHDIGGIDVVWWDPNALELNVEAVGGVRQQEILEDADDGSTAAEEGIRAYRVWQERRAALLARGAEPTERVRPVTAIAFDAIGGGEDGAAPATLEVPGAAEVAIERTAAAGSERPGGARFGTLVHAVLAEVALDAGDDAIAAMAALQGRLLGAPGPEVAAARTAARAALEHPLMRRAAAAAECRREWPLAVRAADGSLAEGVVDLAFREDGAGWTVVDFKSDRGDLAEHPEYRVQVALYCRAIARATGAGARGILLAI